VKPRSLEETLKCSFCHKSQDRVAKLIGASRTYPPAYICDECVNACNSILQQDALSTDSNNKTEGWFHRVKSWWKYGIIEAALFKLR
jgi:ClpX C4-type zinc finger